jgi:hypothetical protein
MVPSAVAHDPLCPQNLSECANGRLLTQPPVVDLEPVDPKGKQPVTERGTGPMSSSTRTVAWAWSPHEQGRETEDGTEADDCRH